MSREYNKILVTGADGFIGSHLVESLVKSGYKVRAFVFYNSFNSCGWLDHVPKSIKDSIEIFSGDIRDPFGVKSAVSGCDVVLHLAALIAIPYSYLAPSAYVDTNVTGTLNILEAAKELDVKKIIHTSTSEVYGTAKYVPIDEDHSLQGQSPYAATKIGADQLALSYFASFETPVTVIRPFNTYGPRQSARAVIPTIITQIASGKKKIRLGSVTPTRDFNYVADTVSGFIAALNAENILGEVINIGSNYEVSIGNTFNIIAKIMNSDAEIIADTVRLRPQESEVERLWACNLKAKRLLNWDPAYGGIGGFEAGLKETVAWFLDGNNLSKYNPDNYVI